MSVVSIVVLLAGLESNIYLRSIVLIRCCCFSSLFALFALLVDLYREYIKNRIPNAIAPPKLDEKLNKSVRMKFNGNIDVLMLG